MGNETHPNETSLIRFNILPPHTHTPVLGLHRVNNKGMLILNNGTVQNEK